MRISFIALLLLCTSLAASADVVVVYGPTKQEKYNQLAKAFRQNQLLEHLAFIVSRDIRVPARLILNARECGEPQAYYDSTQKTVTLCYELVENITTGVIRDFSGGSRENIADTATGALMFVLYHEIGHALVHLLDLPIFAREEDIADAIASYFYLNGPSPVHSVLGAAWFFGEEPAEYTIRHFSDEHSLGPQRRINIICYALGSDPKTFSQVAAQLGLPPQRAKQCPNKYARLKSSVLRLLGPHLVTRRPGLP